MKGATFLLPVALAAAILVACGCDDSSSPEYEIRENQIFKDGLLVWKYTPPATNQWYEYDKNGKKVFGAGCTFDGCHHYFIRYDEKLREIEGRYSNEYRCRDFENLTFPIDTNLAKKYICVEAEPLVKESYKLVYMYNNKDQVIGIDSSAIDFFNAGERF